MFIATSPHIAVSLLQGAKLDSGTNAEAGQGGCAPTQLSKERTTSYKHLALVRAEATNNVLLRFQVESAIDNEKCQMRYGKSLLCLIWGRR